MDIWSGDADGRRRAPDVSDRLQRRVAGDPRRAHHRPRIPGAWATIAALEAYEAERRPATSDLVMLNRRNGPEQVMQLVEERAPDGFNVVTDVLSQQELEGIANNYKRVAGFQVEALNAKPPIVQMPAPSNSQARDNRLPSSRRAPGAHSAPASMHSRKAVCLNAETRLRSGVMVPPFAGTDGDFNPPTHARSPCASRLAALRPAGSRSAPSACRPARGCVQAPRDVNHKLQRKMREHVGDHAGLATPLAQAFQFHAPASARSCRPAQQASPMSALRSFRRAVLFRRACAPALRRRA